MSAAEIYLAVSVGIGMSVEPKPSLEGASLLFDDGERQGVMDADAYAKAVAGIAGYVALGYVDDAVTALERIPEGIVRDQIVTNLFQVIAVGEVWSAEMPVLDEIRSRTRDFLVAIRERRLLERPRVVLA